MIYYKRLTHDQCKDRIRIVELREDGYAFDEIDDYGCLVFVKDTDEITDKDTLKAAEEEVSDLNDTVEDLEYELEHKFEKLNEQLEKYKKDYSKTFAVCDRVNRIKWDLRQVLDRLDQIDFSDVVESEIP